MNLKDSDDQVNIFTFSSWSFSRALESLDRGEMPDSNALLEGPELVDIDDEKHHPYAFEAFLVNTSSKESEAT